MVECKNCRVCVEPGTEICPCCGEKIEKTADEMLSRLGYNHFLDTTKKVDDIVFRKDYECGINQDIIVVPKKEMIFTKVCDLNAGFTYEEILACAKLIEEMVADNGQ